jgi:acyl-CoA hydrolase/GNAT superfamily N-acetyltransferase
MKTPVIDWKEKYKAKVSDAATAVSCIQPGRRVFIGSGAGEPLELVDALAEHKGLTDTEIVHILTLGVAPYAEERLGGSFRHNAYFIGPNVREAVSQGRADYTPIFLSEIPRLFRERRVVIDFALISVSEPDVHGYCSYGVSTDIVKSAAESAKVVIAEISPHTPRTLGDCFIHVDDIDYLVPSDRPVLEAPQGEPDDLCSRIGKHVASLVENGSTLQLGIGKIPDAVLYSLIDYGLKDLGIHSEMFSDGVIPLIEKGIINNRAKTIHPGKIIASFVMGSRKLYDFIDNNPLIEFHPTEYTNDPFIIAQNNKMVAINAAIEVDLTGQVCSDSLGDKFYSGIGGQVDFIRGASRSKGGKAIIALPSTAMDESISRIVPHLKEGAGVVTSRGDVHYVVTEFGCAYLHGKNIRERAMALIQIAHPKFRPWLLGEAKARHLVYSDQIELPVEMTQYPENFEEWIEVKDQKKLFCRPLKLTDESLVRELFYELSPDTIHYRFFHMIKSMPHKKLQDLLRVDYVQNMAMVVLTDSSEGGKMVAIAHYHNDAQTNLAQSSFLVRDDWQGQGIGRCLLNSLTKYAMGAGIGGFTAEVLSHNSGMLRVFHHCGFPVETKLVDGVYELTILFKDAENKHDEASSHPFAIME